MLKKKAAKKKVTKGTGRSPSGKTKESKVVKLIKFLKGKRRKYYSKKPKRA